MLLFKKISRIRILKKNLDETKELINKKKTTKDKDLRKRN